MWGAKRDWGAILAPAGAAMHAKLMSPDRKKKTPGETAALARGGGGDDDLAVDSFWAPFHGEVDVAVDAFDFAGGELPSAGEPFVAVQQ